MSNEAGWSSRGGEKEGTAERSKKGGKREEQEGKEGATTIGT